MTHEELLPALQFTPPTINLNFEELEARIAEITAQYENMIVREEDVAGIKNEMAGLNKLADQLASARKDAVARISTPIKEFEDRVKGLESSVLSTRSFLDEQVKNHIQRERDSRRAVVQFIIDAQKHEHGVTDLHIPIQESWLNKTAKDKAITAEVQGIILAHKRQQEEVAALERARKDRVVALESHSAAMSQSRGYALPFSRLAHLQSMDMPLAEALAQVSKIYDAEDARIAEVEQRKKVDQNPSPVQEETHWLDAPAPIQTPAEPVQACKAMTITGTYSAENGPAISALYQRIKALCLTCTVQIKEI